MARYFNHIQQTHSHILHIMTDKVKITISHQMVTGGKKIIILLPSSTAMKPIPVTLFLMADGTVSLEMTQPQTCSQRTSKAKKSEMRTQFGWLSCKLNCRY